MCCLAGTVADQGLQWFGPDTLQNTEFQELPEHLPTVSYIAPVQPGVSSSSIGHAVS